MAGDWGVEGERKGGEGVIGEQNHVQQDRAQSCNVEWHRLTEWKSLPAELDLYLPVSHTKHFGGYGT